MAEGKRTVLSTVVNKVFMEQTMDTLVEQLTDELVEANDLSMSDPQIQDTVMVDREGHAVARFGNTKLANYAGRNLPRASQERANFALRTVNEFRTAWKTDDVDTQQELFAGLNVVTAMYMGEQTAKTMARAFSEIILFTDLRTMMEAVKSGAESYSEGEKSHNDINPLGTDELSEKTALSVQNIITAARGDRTGQDIKELLSNAASQWADHLESIGGEKNLKDARVLRGTLPIFERTVLLPDTINRKLGILDRERKPY